MSNINRVIKNGRWNGSRSSSFGSFNQTKTEQQNNQAGPSPNLNHRTINATRQQHQLSSNGAIFRNSYRGKQTIRVSPISPVPTSISVNPTPYKDYSKANDNYQRAFTSPQQQLDSAMAQPLTRHQVENKNVLEKHLQLNQQLTPKALTARDAAQRTRIMLKQRLLVKKTESSRPMKIVSPDRSEDCMMRTKLDIEMEQAATKHALQMLNDELYEYNQKAGMAGFSPSEVSQNQRTAWTRLGPIV